MKMEYITQAKTAEVCGPQSKCGNIEVEQSASSTLLEAFPRDDGQTAHPRKLGDGSRTPETWVGKESAAMSNEDSFGKAPKRVVEIDTAKYQKYLDDPSLSDEQKEEIIEALWSIITAFVDLGFGIHPMQEVCGQLSQEVDQEGEEDSNDPKPEFETLRGAFNAASDDT